MASPPFNIDTTIPSDVGIVSQFPNQERTMRDNAKSWLLVNHNTNGRHDRVDLDVISTPTAATATTLVKWVDSTGQHFQRWGGSGVGGANSTEFVGVPPSTIIMSASSNFVGYLYCNGQAVSRSTFARLFSYIGTTYGSGDGSTTFNLPDLRGRAPFGIDNMGGAGTTNRLSSFLGSSGVLGTTGGDQNPHAHNHGVNDPTHSHSVSGNTGTESVGHTHDTFVSLSGTTGTMNSNTSHHHDYTQANNQNRAVSATGANTTADAGNFSASTSDTNIDHTHNWSGSGTFTSGGESVGHVHFFSAGTSGSGTGISIQNTFSGSSGNLPPLMILYFLIKF